MAVDRFAIGETGCNCSCNSGGNFHHTFTMYGCASPAHTPNNFSGLTVSVYDHSGGSLLASGTTNSGGAATLTWTDSGTPTRYVTSTTPWVGRNDAYAGSLVLTNNGSHTLSLAASTGYVCCQLDFAVPTTLHWTGGEGSYPLTYNSGSWSSGTISTSNSASKAVTFYSGNACTCVTVTAPIKEILGASCNSSGQVGAGRNWVEMYCPGNPLFYNYQVVGCAFANDQPGNAFTYVANVSPPFAFSGSLSASGGGSGSVSWKCERNGMTSDTCSLLQHWIANGNETERRHAIYRLSLPDAIGCKPTTVSYPSLFRQATNAAQAVGSAIVSAVRGEPVMVPSEEQDRRLAICHACDKFDPKQGRCRLCGCFANLKARIASEHCPDEPPKW